MKKPHSISKRITFAKVLLPTLVTIGLFIFALFWVVIPRFENLMLDRKREMIRELTYTTVSMINSWHQLEISGELSLPQAQESAINQLKTLRYGEELKDYFWVIDSHPRMVVHPYRPDLNGNDLSNVFDSNKKYLFVEMVSVVDKQGEGFVDYMWQWKDDSTRIVPKLSFVKAFEPWQWIIGTGIYIEDVKEEIAYLERRIVAISILITILSSILLSYIAFQNYQSEKRKKVAEAELSESREKYRMLVEASGEGLIMILENRQVFYNKAIYSLLGYENSSPELELSKIFRSPPDSKTFDFINLHKKSETETSEQLESMLVRRDGTIINAFLVISPITFLNNDGVVISVKDISRHKEMEEVLDYTKEKYLALTNQLTIGVFRTTPDPDARFTEVNPALKNMLGVGKDAELLSTSLFDFFADQTLSDVIIENLWQNGFIKNKVIQLKKSNRITSTVSLSAVLVKDINEKLISIDGIIEDISEQFRTEKDREKLIFDLQTSVHTLSQRVGGFVKKLYTCAHTAPISAAIKTMTSNNCNALLVTGSEGEEIGFLSDHDLRERVLASSLSLETPVYSVMSSPIYTISAASTIYEALVKYRRYKIRKLVVKHSDNKVVGFLSIDDIFDASYTNFLFFIQNIEHADQIPKIREYRDQLLILVRSLIEYDTNIHSITNFITLISDTITKRIIELAMNEIGEPPTPFAFIAMGSEGREEQTLATDQDNAIIYQDVSPENEPDVKKYFNLLGEKICDNLAAVGYQHCKGNMMAKNEKWCQPCSVWKRYFTSWVTTSSPQDLLDVKIFFDFRHIYGDETLATQLQNHIRHLTASYHTFFVYLAESVLGVAIPENMQKLKNPIDLKLLLLPLVDFARLYSLKYKIDETNTFRRLEAIVDQGVITASAFKSISFCYSYLMQARLKRQIECFDGNIQPDNIVPTAHFTDIDLTLFKKYFDVLEALRNKLRLDFKGTKI